MTPTERKKLEANIRFKNTKAFLENGMIDLLDATKQIYNDYLHGHLAYGQAIDAIKLLAKVKTPA